MFKSATRYGERKQTRAPPDTADPATAAQDNLCRYDLVTTRAGFDALASEWDELFTRAGRGCQVFQTFSWNWHWCNHYLDAGNERGLSLAVVTGRCGGRLALVWPLVMRRGSLVQLTSMGDPVSQYSDAVVENTPDASALLRAALEYAMARVKPDLVSFRRVREDAAIAPLMAEFRALNTHQQQAPFIDLSRPGGFAAYMESRSAHWRKKRRSANKRLARLKPIFASWTHGPTARQLAQEGVAMKRAQLMARGLVSPAYSDRRFDAFFADVADYSAHLCEPIAYTLDCTGEPASINIILGCKDRLVGHIFAYALKFEKEGVGAHLIDHMLQQSFSSGHATFDLLGPADGYKLRWADGTAEITDWAIPRSAKGSAYAHAYLMHILPMMKWFVRSLPTALRELLD